MATLVRPKVYAEDYISQDVLSSTIPKPFPSRAEREHEELLETLAAEHLDLEDASSSLPGPSTGLDADQTGTQSSALGDSATANGSRQQDLLNLAQCFPQQNTGTRHEDLLPSIRHVQTSCLMALNDLLSISSTWIPIVPDRRHSMPPHSPSATSTTAPPQASHPNPALYTLVRNLRYQDTERTAARPIDNLNDVELLNELRERVERMTARMGHGEAHLPRRLLSLLEHMQRLSTLYPTSANPTSPRVASWSSLDNPQSSAPSSSVDPFGQLRRQLSDFQLERTSLDGESLTKLSPVQNVEAALLWTRIDEELETVLSLCRSPAEAGPSSDHLPPEYDPADYERDFGDADSLPQYEPSSPLFADAGTKSSYKAGETLAASTSQLGLNEKKKMDLEAVTLAIERLYLVAPQLHNQRVELKKSKLEAMEKAKVEGAQKAKGKERDTHELERMVDLLGRASEREMVDQAVVLDDRLKARMEKAQQKAKAKRAAFVEHLAEHSDAGRLHSQDAVFHPPAMSKSVSQPDLVSSKVQDPYALLTLPEALALRVRENNPETLLSLPEFIKEGFPEDAEPDVVGTQYLHRPSEARRSSRDRPTVEVPSVAAKVKKGYRSRSLSAPPLAWLLSGSSSRPSSPTSGTSSELKKSKSRLKRPGSSSGKMIVPMHDSLDISYVAEHHENLQHVLVFLTVSGLRAGVNLEAEAVADGTNGDQASLVLRSGVLTSPPLKLPAPVATGKKEVKVVGGRHYEIKLPVSLASPSFPSTPVEPGISTLLDATYFTSARPTSFICSSCSLPLVQASQLHVYRDLPSEHWAELVDAWMCHADQSLHEHVRKGSKDGFWPREGEVLVGGSYVLLREETTVKNNFCEPDVASEHDDWRRVRCICGALVGRCQEHKPSDGPSVMVYRLAKYAFRPVSPTTEPCRVPLSAFIVEDMNEFVHAHATYRFVIVDEEEERPRILIWLFKPNMRLAYATPTQYVIPKRGTIHAAKVLFKFLKSVSSPSDLDSILNKYPGFPQAEHLYYPIDVCRRLATLLKESNTAYPESMRTMTGLDVGWLHRV